jgi:predicted esterase
MLLSKQGKFIEAAELLEETVARFPSARPQTAFQTAVFYVMTGNPHKAMDVLESAQKEKIPFPIWPGAMPMAKLQGEPRFKKIVEANSQLQAELSAAAKPDVFVQTPAGYSESNSYPLFLVLHHWNAAAAGFSRFWQSKRAAKKYITAYVQSSQVVGPGTFGWSDFNKGKEDIKAVYDQIVEKYPIDISHVVVGGFSQGGMLAVHIALAEVLPAAGFVVLQPGGDTPGILKSEYIKKAAERGLCGTLITGAADRYYKQQREMNTTFQNAGLDLRFIAKPGLGHGMPKGLPRLINAALKHIEKKGVKG